MIREEIENGIVASMLLFAYGDAYGYVTEFMPHEQILKAKPDVPNVLTVSDDTQMSLYTIQAVEELSHHHGYDFSDDAFMATLLSDEPTQNTVRREFARQYLLFASDADNNRAPGGTVMRALAEYEQSEQKTGLEGGSTNYSLGCGTVMRAPWLGLLPWSRKVITALSILQAQTTHGDPAGWLVSAVSSLLAHDLLTGKVDTFTENLFDHALTLLDEIEGMETSLTAEMKKPGTETGYSDIERVRGDFRDFSESYEDDSETLLLHPTVDVTSFYGQGWIADEALYNAVAVASLYSDGDEEDVLAGIKRLVYSNGDSDSIAAIGGAFFGARGSHANNGFAVHQHTLQNITESLEPRYRREITDAGNFILSQWDARLSG